MFEIFGHLLNLQAVFLNFQPASRHFIVGSNTQTLLQLFEQEEDILKKTAEIVSVLIVFIVYQIKITECIINIGTPYILTILVLKFEIVHSTTS